MPLWLGGNRFKTGCEADTHEAMMKFVNPLPFVNDMERSKRFYPEVLRLLVIEAHGDFVRFEKGFALHGGISLHQTIFGEAPADCGPYGRRNLVLYFEVAEIEAASERVAHQIELIHEVRRQDWGQLVFRFFDPENRVVKIG